MPEAPLITVAICTRNRVRFLDECVQSVLPQLGDNCDLLIVDNASTDDTAQLAQRLADENRAVSAILQPQLGLSHARNAAIHNARGEWVLFLDDDAVAADNWLAAYRAFLKDLPSPKVATVGGAVFPRFETSPPRWIDQSLYRMDCGPRSFAFDGKGGPWGGNIAYRRQTILDIGGFDTELGRKGDFQGAHEESFLSTQLQKAGHEIWWLPGAAIHHFVPVDRFRVKSLWRLSFDVGRSSALIRLKRAQGRAKSLFILQRTLISPLQIVARLLGAAALLLVGKTPQALKQWLGAARALGFSYQLLVDTKRNSSP